MKNLLSHAISTRLYLRQLLACLTIFSVALSCRAADIEPQSSVTVRGQPSQIATINLGPGATKYWAKIQAFLQHGDLTDYQGVVAALQLRNANDPLKGEVGLDESGLHHYADGEFLTAKYSQLFDSGNKSAFLDMQLKMDLSKICIPEEEVRRIYGKGRYSVVMDKTWRPGEFEDRTGEPHDLGFTQQSTSRMGFSFAIAASGCVEAINLNELGRERR